MSDYVICVNSSVDLQIKVNKYKGCKLSEVGISGRH